MGLILNIETATRACSVALGKDGVLVSFKETQEERSHAKNITIFIEQLLFEEGLSTKDLDAIAVSKGPGSYTGLRIGVSTSKGLCYALGIPLIAINSLESMAQGYLEKNATKNILLCPMIDARRMEVYTAIYDGALNVLKKTSAEIIAENSFSEQLKFDKMVFIGQGADKCRPFFEDHENAIFETADLLSARSMVSVAERAFRKGKFEDLAYFEPLYLKDFVAGKPKQDKI